MSFFTFLLVLCLVLIVPISKCERNNVCSSLPDYYTKEINPQCWYDADLYHLRANKILNRYKYIYEVYDTVTIDGYILSVYRLPPKTKKSKGIVFLSHPALTNMIVWIDKGKNSLAFMLVDEGYDVYMGNFRGTLYSQKHVTLSRTLEPNRYWNFSFHEMGIYDLPAQLELVKNISESFNKIYYVGHSLGGTTAYIYASLLPKHAENYIQLFILWAPAVIIDVDKSIFKLLAPFTNLLLKIINWFHLTNLFAYNDIHLLVYFKCFEFPRTVELCNYVNQLVFGKNPEDVYPPLNPSLYFHNGYGFSAKAAAHYAQLYNSRRFQRFDYGNLNKYYYHSLMPPEYPIENITSPVYFFIGSKDTVAPPEVQRRLYSRLRPDLQYGINEVSYNHVNFLYGKNLIKNLHVPTINIIKNISV